MVALLIALPRIAGATTCAGAITLNPASLPITNQALVCGGTNDLNDMNVPGLCGGMASTYYKNGNEALYTITPTSTGSYPISYSGQTWCSVQVYIGCPTNNNCVDGANSTGNSVSLNVTLNAGTQYFIWFDTWPSPNSPCPGTFSIGAPQALPSCGDPFYDPGGPGGNYPNNSNVTQTICPDTPGDAVTLTFTQFNTEANFDLMTIYDGPNTTYSSLGTFSGTTIPGPFTATDPSGCLTVVFTSDASFTYSGWVANITCSPWVPPPSACGTLVYDPGGAAGNYPNNSNFIRTYCPDNPGDAVTLIFNTFLTEATYDVLTIYNGPTTGAPVLGTYSGSTLPPTFTSSHPSGCLTIQFTSDGSVSNAGWSALVVCQAIPSGDCVYALIMEDSGNNGWGSSKVGVRINGGAWTYYTVTGSMNVVLLGVVIGDLVEVSYDDSGPNQNQNRYSISKLGQGPYFTSSQPPVAGITYSQIVTCGPPPAPPQDCAGGITVCSALAINNNATNWGETQDLNASNQGCLSTEHMGTWYFFSPQTAGNIGFSISPTNGTDDYDFAVWGPYTEAQCPAGPPLRCSWNAPPDYVVGLGNGATDFTEDASGDGWVKTIDVVAGQVYVMYIDNWSASGQAFTLNWQLSGGASLDCTTLPIELLDLDAKPNQRVIDVSWATASELNALHYEVQRSGDNQDWKHLGTVPAAGNSLFRQDYLFVDQAPLPGINYYRLKQVDVDGASSLTHAVIAYMMGDPARPVIFPNPAMDHLRIAFSSSSTGDARLYITDATGRAVAGTALPVARGEQNTELPIAHLAKGWYSLRVILPDGTPLQATGFLKQ
ncbi:MAG: hypothetical protein J5I62_02060 [Flavobacteriales bacterium]|nr:hypothetical protein [Flavobacteriales bacterium]MEB2340835.1 hypothetical protein [Flavobacteriia bacterium]